MILLHNPSPKWRIRPEGFGKVQLECKMEFRKGTDLKLKKNSQACLYIDVFPPTHARNLSGRADACCCFVCSGLEHWSGKLNMWIGVRSRHPPMKLLFLMTPYHPLLKLLDKLVVLKLNGGLGTTMDCTGPKYVIEGSQWIDIP